MKFSFQTALLTLLVGFSFSTGTVAWGQEQSAHGYTIGQKILWRDGITGKWEEGIYVGSTPEDTQPIIHRKAGDPNSQTAYDWERIKQPTLPDSEHPADTANDNGKKSMPQRDGQPADSSAGQSPLTEAEILNFLADRLGNDPFADSEKLQQTKNELGALIKKRGTAFLHNSAVSEFGQKMSAFGMTSEVMGPLGHNYGAPNSQDWLFGSWVTSKTGLPVHWVEGDKLVTWLEVGAANTGVVTINKDGTYRWNTDSAQGVIEGKWHAAGEKEMGDQGGAGVVLENAKSGESWVAYKYRAGNPNEEWLGLAQVNHRSIREGGVRLPAEQVGNVKVVPEK